MLTTKLLCNNVWEKNLQSMLVGKILCSTGAVLDCLASGEPRPDTVWVTAEGVSLRDEDKDEDWWMYYQDEDMIMWAAKMKMTLKTNS